VRQAYEWSICYYTTRKEGFDGNVHGKFTGKNNIDPAMRVVRWLERLKVR
jgi:hypothetical protein